MTYVRDPRLQQMFDELDREFDERMSRLSPEELARVRARVAKEIAEAARDAAAAAETSSKSPAT